MRISHHSDASLVDPASIHIHVSKNTPSFSQCKAHYSETANGSLIQLWFLRWLTVTSITVVILELIHANIFRTFRLVVIG